MGFSAKLFITSMLFLIHTNNIYSATFLEWYEIVSKKDIKLSDFDKLISQEIQAGVLEGSYKRYLNAHYLTYEKNHWNNKKLNTEFEIRKQNELRLLSKYIEHDMYFTVTINYTKYIEDQSKKLEVLKSLKEYVNQFKSTNRLKSIHIDLADCFYKLNKNNKAIEFWNKSLEFIDEKDFLTKSSMLNNIACAYDHDKKLPLAIKYNKLAIKELNKIKYKNSETKAFYYILLSNSAFYAKANGNKEIAIKAFKLIYEFYLNNESYNFQIIEPVIELFELVSIDDLKKMIDIKKIKSVFSKMLKEKELIYLKQINFYFLVKYNEKNGNYKEALKYLLEDYLFNNQVFSEQIKKLNLTNQLLQEEKVQNELIKANLLNESERKKNNLLYGSAFLVTLLLFTMLLLYQRNKRKDTKLELKEKELELAQKEVLEKELQLKKELAANLELSLSVKKKSEEVFLEKLKELKRKKNYDPDELMKELQLQIMNLPTYP